MAFTLTRLAKCLSPQVQSPACAKPKSKNLENYVSFFLLPPRHLTFCVFVVVEEGLI